MPKEDFVEDATALAIVFGVAIFVLLIFGFYTKASKNAENLEYFREQKPAHYELQDRLNKTTDYIIDTLDTEDFNAIIRDEKLGWKKVSRSVKDIVGSNRAKMVAVCYFGPADKRYEIEYEINIEKPDEIVGDVAIRIVADTGD